MSVLQLTEKVFTATRFRHIPDMLEAEIRGKRHKSALDNSFVNIDTKRLSSVSRFTACDPGWETRSRC